MKVESESIIWFYRYFLIIVIVCFVVLIVGGLVIHPDVRASEASLLFGKAVKCVNDMKSFSALEESKLFSCIGLGEGDAQRYYVNIDIRQDSQPTIFSFGEKSYVGCAEKPKEKETFCSSQMSRIILDGKPALLTVYTEIK